MCRSGTSTQKERKEPGSRASKRPAIDAFEDHSGRGLCTVFADTFPALSGQEFINTVHPAPAVEGILGYLCRIHLRNRKTLEHLRLGEARAREVRQCGVGVVRLGHGAVTQLANDQIRRVNQVGMIDVGVERQAEQIAVTARRTIPARHHEPRPAGLGEDPQRPIIPADSSHGEQHQVGSLRHAETCSQLVRWQPRPAADRCDHDCALGTCAYRLGLDSTAGELKHRFEGVGVPQEPCRCVGVPTVDPIPGEVLHQGAGQLEPVGGSEADRRDVTHHRIARHLPAVRNHGVERGRWRSDQPIETFDGRLKILVQRGALDQPDVGFEVMDAVLGRERLREEPGRHGGENLEPQTLSHAGHGIHDGTRARGVTEAVGRHHVGHSCHTLPVYVIMRTMVRIARVAIALLTVAAAAAAQDTTPRAWQQRLRTEIPLPVPVVPLDSVNPFSGPLDSLPTLMGSVAPRRVDVFGEALAAAYVDAKGECLGAVPLVLPFPGLTSILVDEFQAAKFEPARIGTTPQPSWTVVKIKVEGRVKESVVSDESLEAPDPTSPSAPVSPPPVSPSGNLVNLPFTAAADLTAMATPRRFKLKVPARATGITVRALVHVTPEGRCDRFVPLDLSPGFDAWLSSYLSSWRLDPANRDGEPIACWVVYSARADIKLSALESTSFESTTERAYSPTAVTAQ